jgi:hypothetical protein
MWLRLATEAGVTFTTMRELTAFDQEVSGGWRTNTFALNGNAPAGADSRGCKGRALRGSSENSGKHG